MATSRAPHADPPSRRRRRPSGQERAPTTGDPSTAAARDQAAVSSALRTARDRLPHARPSAPPVTCARDRRGGLAPGPHLIRSLPAIALIGVTTRDVTRFGAGAATADVGRAAAPTSLAIEIAHAVDLAGRHRHGDRRRRNLAAGSRQGGREANRARLRTLICVDGSAASYRSRRACVIPRIERFVGADAGVAGNVDSHAGASNGVGRCPGR